MGWIDAYLAHQVSGVIHYIAPNASALHEARVGGIQAEGQQQGQGKAGESEWVIGFQA